MPFDHVEAPSVRVLTFGIQKEPGFRLNLIDLALLAALGLLTGLLRGPLAESHLYLLPAYVGLSFFQFCNLFRIGNRLERFWYTTFIAAAAIGFQRPEIFWPLVLGVCEPLKLGLILRRIRAPGYHGICHRAIEAAAAERARRRRKSIPAAAGSRRDGRDGS